MSLIAGAGAMGGTSCLRCYVLDGARHQGRPAWEALLQHASRIGISGGSVFTAMAGFGHQHIVRQEVPSLVLHPPQTLQIEFLVTAGQAEQLLEWARQEGIRLFHATAPAQLATTGGPADQSAPRAAEVSGVARSR